MKVGTRVRVWGLRMDPRYGPSVWLPKEGATGTLMKNDRAMPRILLDGFSFSHHIAVTEIKKEVSPE